ncbi:MAG: cold-shock protein [Cyclobacteriaceae bacterium]|nr:cold-shock protein [Cyclobacteriaceae bacterium]
MKRSNNSYIKKLKAEKKRKKKEEKAKKMDERKKEPKSSGLDDMMAYVDEFGNISAEPPEE